MNYATYQTEESVHVHHIKPLDARIVKLNVSVRISEYGSKYSNTHLALYSSLLLTGTQEHNKVELDAYMKKHGIELHISSSAGCIHFMCTVRDKNIAYAVSLLSELIYTPKFSRFEFATKVATFIEENRESSDNAKLISEIQFRELLYPPSSFMRIESLAEQRTILQNSTLKFINQVQKSMTRGEWYLSVVGSNAVRASIEKLIAVIKKNSRPVEHNDIQTRILSSRSTYTTIPGKTNVEIRIGNLLPITERDDDYVPFAFGLSVLGKVGGFSGRLMSTVREKEGLTYGIYAQTNSYNALSTGHWNIFTFFSAKDLSRGIASTKREIALLVSKGITERELEIFKEIYRNQFLISHDSNAGRINLYHNALLNGDTVLDIEREMSTVDSLTITLVNNAIRKYIDPDTLIISGAGPVRKNGAGIVL